MARRRFLPACRFIVPTTNSIGEVHEYVLLPQLPLLGTPAVDRRAATSARLALMPPDPSLSLRRELPSMLWVALAIRIAFTASGSVISAGLRSIICATTPVTMGAAKLVPEPILPTNGEEFVVLTMKLPGAATSGFSRSLFCDVGSTKL